MEFGVQSIVLICVPSQPAGKQTAHHHVGRNLVKKYEVGSNSDETIERNKSLMKLRWE